MRNVPTIRQEVKNRAPWMMMMLLRVHPPSAQVPGVKGPGGGRLPPLLGLALGGRLPGDGAMGWCTASVMIGKGGGFGSMGAKRARPGFPVRPPPGPPLGCSFILANPTNTNQSKRAQCKCGSNPTSPQNFYFWNKESKNKKKVISIKVRKIKVRSG